MEKKEIESVDIYEGKISVEERLILLLTGIFCFPVGFALYFYFKDKRDGKYHMHFARVGSWAGVIFVLILLISAGMFALANLLQF